MKWNIPLLDTFKVQLIHILLYRNLAYWQFTIHLKILFPECRTEIRKRLWHTAHSCTQQIGNFGILIHTDIFYNFWMLCNNPCVDWKKLTNFYLDLREIMKIAKLSETNFRERIKRFVWRFWGVICNSNS